MRTLVPYTPGSSLHTMGPAEICPPPQWDVVEQQEQHLLQTLCGWSRTPGTENLVPSVISMQVVYALNVFVQLLTKDNAILISAEFLVSSVVELLQREMITLSHVSKHLWSLGNVMVVNLIYWIQSKRFSSRNKFAHFYTIITGLWQIR